ncbi:hypothetical protein CU254_34195 [Amycolatopsis sp. AA4]|nr:hypothetical protein CU254_34195 [Amycolatopsis sp. AA4]
MLTVLRRHWRRRVCAGQGVLGVGGWGGWAAAGPVGWGFVGQVGGAWRGRGGLVCAGMADTGAGVACVWMRGLGGS